MRTAPHPRPARRSQQRGAALIETLVAILIFAFGVLGVIGLQSSMTRAQTAAKFRGDAAYLASELTGTMWADIINVNQYDTGSGRCAAHARCQAWLDKVVAQMPGGTADLSSVAGGDVTVTINWAVPGEGTHRYQNRTAVVPVQ